jgi:3-methyladenine DNA glycosylase AlkD
MAEKRLRLVDLERDLRRLSNPKQAKVSARFFKTGQGQYGEGDKFLGITVPKIRVIARTYRTISLTDIAKLMASPYHEARLCALLILVENFTKTDEKGRKEIYSFYLKNLKWVNNWDLVDLSAPKIIGSYLLHHPRAPLYKLVKSNNIWERRVAIVATYEFIRHNDFIDTIKISAMLLRDKHDLIHKAVGWMLREVGKRDSLILEDFLRRYYKIMPRTMLRYAIEKFPEYLRQQYLQGLV